MKPIFKNILAVIVGWIGGSLLNMGLINMGHIVYPIEGVDPSNMEALAKIMPTLDYNYFIFPFLAHALGTLFGAFIAAKIAVDHKKRYALIVGALFLLGGILVNIMIPGPMWFTIADIFFAYIPMALIGIKLANR